MEKPLFWIIDDEWPDYSVEEAALKAAYPDCDIRYSGIPFQQDLEDFGAQADVVFAQVSADITADVIAKLKRCKGIAVFGSGYNNVDVQAAKAAGIPVTNVNGYCTEDIAAMFHFYKPIEALYGQLKNGAWGVTALSQPVHRLSRQTLLLMGFGYIGKVTAQRAHALGMTVLAYDPFVTDEAAREFGAEKVDLDEGLARADFVSVHVRLMPETTGLVDLDLMRKMKPSAVLVNTARGNLVDEDALYDALKANRICGAGLDVFAQEPLPNTSKLLELDNLVLSPHFSSQTVESLWNTYKMAIDIADDFFQGRDCPHILNPEYKDAL